MHLILARLAAAVLLISSAAEAGDSSLMAGPVNAPKPVPAGIASMDDLAVPSPLGDMALGSAEAPVTVIEYASMTCSHCAAFSADNFPKLKADYIDTGKVRYVFREFPLDIKAVAGSILARCIAKGDSNKFFELTGNLFRTQDDWAGNDTGDKFKAIARNEGLEEAQFEACFADQSAVAGIERTQDIAAEKLKVTSTPSFFINGVLVKGNAYSEIEKAIKEAK